MPKKLVIMVILLATVVLFANHQNDAKSIPAYQNHTDQSIKAFKVNNPSKM